MKNKSIWLNKATHSFNKIEQDMEVDVLIVGGGITGLSTLLELQNSKLRIILVERNICGCGVTSRSTAKITYLQEKIYMNIRKSSADRASLYLKSQVNAVSYLKNIINKYHIDCDFYPASSYLFTSEEKNVTKLEEEFDFLTSNGIHVEKTKLDGIDNLLALKVDDTYTFHPLKYLNYLKNEFQDSIFENSKVEKIDRKDEFYYSYVNGFKIKSRYVVLATHYPYFLISLLFPFKNHVETSYIGAKEVKQSRDISAINIDQPCISLRYYKEGTKNYLIYLFQSFSSCNIKSIQSNFNDLNKQDQLLPMILFLILGESIRMMIPS